jgi:hypothetical protein
MKSLKLFFAHSVIFAFVLEAALSQPALGFNEFTHEGFSWSEEDAWFYLDHSYDGFSSLVALPVRVVDQLDDETVLVEPVRLSSDSADFQYGVSEEMMETSRRPGERVKDFFFDLESAGPMFSVRVSNPQILSMSFGYVIGKMDFDFLAWERSGVFLEADIGLGGIKGSVGAISQAGLGFLLIGSDIKASVLRTWVLSGSVAPGQTYVGGEVDLYAFIAKFSFGVFHRISDPGPLSQEESDWLLSLGVGLGF